MRGMLDYIDIKGCVIIGEGEKDEAPMLYCGEMVGMQNSDSMEVDIAVDPVDGTTMTANGMGNAISVIAMGERGSMMSIPCFYALKLACGPELRGHMDLRILCSVIRLRRRSTPATGTRYPVMRYSYPLHVQAGECLKTMRSADAFSRNMCVP